MDGAARTHVPGDRQTRCPASTSEVEDPLARSRRGRAKQGIGNTSQSDVPLIGLGDPRAPAFAVPVVALSAVGDRHRPTSCNTLTAGPQLDLRSLPNRQTPEVAR